MQYHIRFPYSFFSFFSFYSFTIWPLYYIIYNVVNNLYNIGPSCPSCQGGGETLSVMQRLDYKTFLWMFRKKNIHTFLLQSSCPWFLRDPNWRSWVTYFSKATMWTVATIDSWIPRLSGASQTECDHRRQEVVPSEANSHFVNLSKSLT